MGRSRFHARITTLRVLYASGEFMDIEPRQGNITVNNMNADNFEDVRVKNRTKQDGHVEGPDLEQDVAFTIEMERATTSEAAAKRIKDVFFKTGIFAGATSVDDVIAGSWIFEIDWSDGTTSGQLQLPEVTGTISFSEGETSNTYDFSGRNVQAPVWT